MENSDVPNASDFFRSNVLCSDRRRRSSSSIVFRLKAAERVRDQKRLAHDIPSPEVKDFVQAARRAEWAERVLIQCLAMLIRILGSAAGGGVPQWNCGCRQCDAARSGLLDWRTQCSIGISVDARRWVLVNASPDLRYQLTYSECRPPPETRQSPIEAILLSDADLDHTLGLPLLRESDLRLPIYASEAIKEAVEEGRRMTDVLSRYCGIQWLAPP
jgi:hypothetical protein